MALPPFASVPSRGSSKGFLRMNLIRPVLPDPSEFTLKLMSVLEQKAAAYANNMMLPLLQAKTKQWKHKVVWQAGASRQASHRGSWRRTIVVFAGTNDPIFRYIDQGVKPHEIRPTSRGALSFIPTHGARVVPPKSANAKANQSKYGKRHGYSVVEWPGIKARNWTEEVAKEVQEDFVSPTTVGMFRKVFQDYADYLNRKMAQRAR